MNEYLSIFVGSVIINNFVLTRFLGLCIFFGVSKNVNTSFGMGMAVTSVMTFSSILAWVIYNFVLVRWHLESLKIVIFVLLIAIFVQLLEMLIRKYAQTLYQSWGIYLLLIATNCVVLGVPLISVDEGFNFTKTVVLAIGSGLGFMLAIVMMASLREKLRFADVPKPLEGLGIAFILAGLLALSFMGFSGIIK